MSNFCIFRWDKLHTNGEVGACFSHMFRLRKTDNADLSKEWMNDYGQDKTPDVVTKNGWNREKKEELKKFWFDKYKKRLPVKPHKNNVRAIEFLVTFSPGALNSADAASYFKDAWTFLKKKMGEENHIGFSIHYDETTPHMTVLFVPRVEERLNARHFFGGAKLCSQWQTEFWQEVGQKYGLDRGIEKSKATHEDIKKYYAAMKDANRILKESKELMTEVEKEKKNVEVAKEKMAKIASEVKAKRENLTPAETETEKQRYEAKIDNAIAHATREAGVEL